MMAKILTQLVLLAFLSNIFAPTLIFAATVKEDAKKTELNLEVDSEMAELSSKSVNKDKVKKEDKAIENKLKDEKKEKKDESKQNAGEEPPPGTPTYTPPKSQPQDPMDFLKGLSGTFQTDLFTGSASFSYPLLVPSGRLNMTPALALNYSSLDTKLSNMFGYGWSMSTGSIYRSTSKGVDKLYSQNDFSSDIFGSGGELVLTDSASSIYQAKTEGTFTKYIFSNNTWTAYDTNGTKYIFGSSDSNRQSNPNDTTKVYKWMLEKIEDTNGNFISFTYYKENGQIYPDKIRYTNYGSASGIYEVQFVRTAAPKKISSYVTGFKVTTDYLIDKIDIYSYATGAAVSVRTYDFDYNSSNNSLNKLSSITIKNGGLSYPPTKFTYYGSGAIGQSVGLLQKIEFPLGAIETFSYKKSTAYKTSSTGLSNKNLPFSIDTINKVTKQASSAGPAYTYTYDYEGGHYYYDDSDAYKKEYSGFHSVTMTDPKSNKIKMYFHQSEFSNDNSNSVNYGEFDDHISKKGRIYRQEIYDLAGNLFKTTISKWDKKSLISADSSKKRYFVFLARNTDIDYDGDSDYRAKGSENTYDDYGNILTSIDYGEVTLNNQKGEFTDILYDKVTSLSEYSSNSSKYLYAYPKKKILKDYYGNTYGETKIYYDNLSYGNIDKGNNTKNEILKNSSSEYITNNISYNSYGLPIEIKNFRSYPTTITYDSFNLFPATVKNAKNHTSTYTYNYLFGSPETVIDPNGFKSENYFDDLGRIKEMKITNPANTSEQKVLKNYTYDNSVYPSIVTEKIYPNNTDNNGNIIEILGKTYADGYGRSIQVKKEAEGSNYIVSSVIYDELGNVKKELLPYFTTSGAFETIDSGKQGNSYVYDILARPISISNAVGTTTVNYDQWTKTQTDANSHKKDFYFDSRNNLVKVTEYLDGSSYNTIYEYDPLKNLKKITDAKGNIRNMTYDLLGKMLSMENLHKSSDTSFGIWTYEYDENGNLKKITDPKSQVINYSYDEIDRLLTEDSATTIGQDKQYIYDIGPNSQGRLSYVSSFDYNYLSHQTDEGSGYYTISKIYRYDKAGRVIAERQIISKSGFDYSSMKDLGQLTGYDLDLLGNIKSITYPNDLIVTYSYANMGQINSIKKADQTIIANVDYSPINSIAKIEYADGSVTTNTYDINKAYRLTNKTTLFGSSKYQDINYSFDSVGNILQILDKSNTNTAKKADYTYDHLDRLKSATITDAANGQNYSELYVYDIIGNILNKSDIGDYAYNSSHPHAVTEVNNETWNYDANGNLISAGDFIHEWDYQNRLIYSKNPTHEIIYLYDDSGMRVKKKNLLTGDAATYVNKYYETEGSEARAMIYLGNSKIATEITYSIVSISDPSFVPPSRLIFHHTDHLSGANVDTDENGNLLEVLDYYPYGKTRLDDNFSEDIESYANTDYESNYKYTGKEEDEGTGLYYYGARYYNAEVGRFISIDPWSGDISDPQSLNKYSYVRNNPMKYNDPTGNYWNLVAGGIGGAILGVLSQAVDGEVDTASDYVSAAIGGAVGGLVFASNPAAAIGVGGQVLNSVISGATGGAVSSIINQGMSNHTVNTNEVLTETLKEGIMGLIPTPSIKVPSISSVADAITTKLEKGIINNVSLKTETKMITNNVIQGIPGLMIETGVNSLSNQQNNNLSPNIYTVQKGDTLSKVFGSDWKKVAEYNKLSNPNIIHAGDQLKVPGK